ncbi:DUF354 domain-containing protein [Methanosarcina sp. Mfa9]|uniref:DUF354 domain-containing protein n=1 Tax=Methanosarcina sp. Mfa9 TaxID=3439063 RepID=UPI003F847C19
MKVIVDVGHPADVHFFRNIIQNLVDDGHEIKITARRKDVVVNLLDANNFKYELIGGFGKTMAEKVPQYLKKSVNLYKIVTKYKPDILIGFANPFVAQIGCLTNTPSIVFTDTEHAKLANILTFPFATNICTPKCYRGSVPSKKHITFNSYKEMAYLHPDYFQPDPQVLRDLNLGEGSRFIILRFVSWEASHDIGQSGFINKEELITKLERYGRILITSESKLSKDLEQYRVSVPPEKVHDLLYYATMYIGEGATMACEAAILGTPSIYVNTLRVGYLDELEEKYGLVYNFSDPKNGQRNAFDKSVELLKDEKLKNKWLKKRKIMISDMVDVTKSLKLFIEKFPVNIKNASEKL